MDNKLIRHDWTLDEIRDVHEQPFPELMYRAQNVHREFHDPLEVQRCTLLSIKTGGCPEDCAYCPQSAHYQTGVEDEELLELDNVLRAARKAKEGGSTRFCMGAAWREVADGPEFDRVLDMVRGVAGIGLEVCCTLGMMTPDQARRLKEAGLYAYNHNLDTSEDFYKKIISTRSYGERLETLRVARQAGITLCSGGILGMGEGLDDRLSMLEVLAGMNPHPESVPINNLVQVPGTPMEGLEAVKPMEMIRMIATARILMPEARVRLSAGRLELSLEAQALCFLAGANSIFTGDKLLTTSNPGFEEDEKLLHSLGMNQVSAKTS